MAINIRSIQAIDSQVSKILVDGQPVSSSGQMPVSEVWKYYQDIEDREQVICAVKTTS